MALAYVLLLVPCLVFPASGWTAPWRGLEQDFQQCDTDVFLHGSRDMGSKGLVMDDITFRYCPSRVPELWPNLVKANHTMVRSLRLFRGWSSGWPRERRDVVWDELVAYIHSGNVHVLIGSPVTCDAEADDQDWHWTKKLLRRIGKDHVMGIAIGNELELLYTQKHIAQECIDSLWDEGRLWRTFQERVRDVDSMGFGETPITSVFTSGVVYSGAASLPFVNIPHQALVNDFLRNATSTFGKRFVFTFNIYPYFDPTLKIKPPHFTCESAIKIATCFKPGCLANKALIQVRQKMQQLTHRPDERLWIGEIGWSSPKADALSTNMADCPTFSSLEVLEKFYHNFLQWDMSVTSPGIREVHHAFYFTMRDALNFGNQEYFGLIKSCNNIECKIHSKDYVLPELLRRYSWMNVTFISIGSFFITLALCCATCRFIMERRAACKEAQDSSEDDTSSVNSSECE